MIYKPAFGKFKDNCVFWHEGVFYLFSMYMKEGGEYRNVWLAKSIDGVHWDDVGPIIEDCAFYIWAMGVHQVNGQFILNHGSFDKNGAQNVIKLWQSSNLLEWEYLGESYDINLEGNNLPQDARLDAMNVIKTDMGYYGYATGPHGFLVSSDGVKWQFADTKIDFYETPKPPTPSCEGYFEVGGCEQIGGKYYYLGGWFNYMGRTGYGVYSFVADSPDGPFKPDVSAYRLCGNTKRWVSLWARFCRTHNELLVSSYMQQGYSYENGDTWLPPLKKAVVDRYGHLYLAYWPGNDHLAKESVDISTSMWKRYRATKSITIEIDEIINSEDNTSIEIKAKEHPSFAYMPIDISIALLSKTIDAETGIIVSGLIRATCIDKRLTSPSVGLVMKEREGRGTAIWLHSYGLSEIGRIYWHQGYEFECEDTISEGCAAPIGIPAHVFHSFRLIIRKNMFEFYLNDMLVQTFNTTHDHDQIGIYPSEIGFLAMNGSCSVRNLKMMKMNLKSAK
jgi:hypothetical protein